MTTARSIDAAASGYIRHRFVRALNASFVVAIVFGLIALCFGAVAGAARQGAWDQVAVAPLGIGLVLILVLVPIMILVALVGACIDIMHRRIVGLALVALALVLLVFMLLGGLGMLLMLLGADMGASADTPSEPIHVAALLVSCVVAAAVSYELLRHGWWQLTVRTQNYRAARGWRPLLWRVFTSMRRYLGLPAFLAYVGKRRMMASLLYFGVAVLNLGLVMLLLLAVMMSSPTERTAEFDPAVMLAGMAVLLLLNLVGAGALLAKLADARATKLYQNVREWDARAPIIFLRSFNQDDDRLRATGGDRFARWPAGVGRPRTLDEILLEHASPYGPVIAIGDPRDPTPPLGAARVFVEGEGMEWQGVVRGLAGASKAVVMCPNQGEGVQWELDLIAEAGGRLRTIYLASPELDRAATLALFNRLVPSMPEISAKQHAIAAYAEQGQWRVLTAKKLSVESYTAALNTALQALFGLKGEPVKRPSK